MSYPNPEQRAVLDHRRGTLVVLAPAGTGKTRVMADRLAAAISDGIAPGDTLAVTFTNRAAEEMHRAVAHSCGEATRDCRIQTFHGLCAWILRTEARGLGLPSDFVIYDEQDSIDLLRPCLQGVELGVDQAYWTLSQLKSDCLRDRLTLAEVPRLDTRRVALAKNLDHLDPDDDRIPVLTVHQSKGLEFDSVFIAGVTEDEFPGYYAKRDGKIEEEKRLFYVALTRARHRLFISSHETNDRGWRKGKSRFLGGLG